MNLRDRMRLDEEWIKGQVRGKVECIVINKGLILSYKL